MKLVDVVIGTQYGDEGKGRVIDELTPSYDVIARYNGGPNAGHTVVIEEGRAIALHQIPSGVLHPGKINILGNGVFFNPVKFLTERQDLVRAGIDVSPENLAISSAAHLIMPHHIFADQVQESGKGAQGTTANGIAQVAAEKALRIGARAELLSGNKEDSEKLKQIAFRGLARLDLRLVDGLNINFRVEAEEWLEQALLSRDYICNTVDLLQQYIEDGKRVLAEGAQGFGLDIEHGSYPSTTSSSVGVGGALNGLGIPHRVINEVYGVTKAFASRVGQGPFVTEVFGDLADQVRGQVGEAGREVGATTGRDRRIGYLDLPAVRRAIATQGIDKIILTKLDWLPKFGETILVATAYKYDGGTDLEYAPTSSRELAKCKPIYSELQLWDESETVWLREATSVSRMPKKAKDYISHVNEGLGGAIALISTGADRGQLKQV